MLGSFSTIALPELVHLEIDCSCFVNSLSIGEETISDPSLRRFVASSLMPKLETITIKCTRRRET